MNASVLEPEFRSEKHGFDDMVQVSATELLENPVLRSEVRHRVPISPWFLAWEQWQMRMGLLPQSHAPVSRSGIYTDFN